MCEQKNGKLVRATRSKRDIWAPYNIPQSLKEKPEKCLLTLFLADACHLHSVLSIKYVTIQIKRSAEWKDIRFVARSLISLCILF